MYLWTWALCKVIQWSPRKNEYGLLVIDPQEERPNSLWITHNAWKYANYTEIC